MIPYQEFVLDMTQKRKTINDNISTYLQSNYDRGLLELLQYATSSGKRLRGLLLSLIGEYYKCDSAKTAKLAISAELGHAASLVHDDIMDHAKIRRGKQSLWARYGLERGVIVPHILLSDFLEIARSVGEVYEKIGLETWHKAAIGQYLDLLAEDVSTHSQIDYINMIELKSGALFEGAAEIAAVLARGTTQFIAEAKRFGRILGSVYQLSDDFVGMFFNEEGGSNKLFKTHLQKNGVDTDDHDQAFNYVIEWILSRFQTLDQNKEFVLFEKLRYFSFYSLVEIFKESGKYLAQANKALAILIQPYIDH